MLDPQRTQCLVFVVHAESLKGNKKPCKSLTREKLKSFALLPHAVRCNHPEIVALFSQNCVEVVDSDSEYPALYSGVQSSRVEIVEMLLDEDGEIYGSDTKSLGYLHVTVHNGNRKLMKLLLPNKFIVHPQMKFGAANVRSAVDEQNQKFMEQMLAKGANISCRRPAGGNLLHFAVEHCHEFLVTVLLKSRADVNATKKDGSTPLHIAADKGHLRICEQLLQYDPNINASITASSQLKGATPLHLAVKKGHTDVVRLLLENKANVDAQYSSGTTVLQLAVEKGCFKLVEDILSFRPDVDNESNRSAFFHAMNETRLVYGDIVRRLFDYGLRVGPEDSNNFALLRGAVRLNCVPVVHEFLRHGVDLNDHERHGEIRSLLHVAVEHADEEMVVLLLKNGACIESNCYYLKRTPIFAAAGRGRLKNLRVLLESGAKVEVKDIFGLTPLQVASENGHSDVVEVLLKSDVGVGVNSVCEKGRSALFYAVTNGHLKVVDILMAFGARSDVRDRYSLTPLRVACSNGHCELVEILLRNGADVNAECAIGKTALWVAVEKGHKTVVEQLLEFNALVDCRDEGGMTPLHVVSRLGSAEIVEVLLRNDANINAICLKRRTPLFYAAVGGHLKVVEILLRACADTDLRDVDGKTVLQAAAVEGSKALEVSEQTMTCDTHVSQDLPFKAQSVVEVLLKFGARLDFMHKFKPVVFNLAAFSNPETFKSILECCFTDCNPFIAGGSWDFFDLGLTAGHAVYLGSKLSQFLKSFEMLAQHFVKIWAFTSLTSVALPESIWCCKEIEMNEFVNKCEEELAKLKNESVGDSSVSFFDLLTKDPIKIAGFLRNDTINAVLKFEEYKTKFPIYAGMMHYQFLKGSLRKEHLKQCIKACQTRCSHFSRLPYDLKERVLSYLSFRDSKNLLRACKLSLTANSNF